ncbi:MAG: tetratricopeptide repeat protein [Desulfobacteraceae bacterium]|nr:tetratricopeptide repeat protein [Desulfobacteraceae bacterium]
MMQRRILGIVVTAAFAAVLWSCVTPGRQQFDTGMQLAQAGKYQDAIAYLEEAIAKEPNNAQYRKELDALRGKLVQERVVQGRQALNVAEGELTRSNLDAARAQLQAARAVAPDHPEVQQFAREVEGAENRLLEEVRSLYTEAKGFMDNEQWLKASFNLQQIQRLYPNYEDSSRLLLEATRRGGQDYLEKGRALVDREDFEEAQEVLRNALSLEPGNAEARQLMELAASRDNPQYFIDEGRKAAMGQNWDRAVQAYQRASEYDTSGPEVKALVEEIRQKAGQYYIDAARSYMDEGLLLRAFDSFQLAVEHAPDPRNYDLVRLREDLASRALMLATQFRDQEQYGGAWYWFRRIESIHPDFPNIFYLTQSMEDRIRERVTKAIAVFDFTSPTDRPDAGIIVANNLITYLFKTASKDIQILERENLKSILEEMKLGQIGVVTANSAKEMGRVYGIDVAIMGSVLLFNVDASVSEGLKTVRYRVGDRIEDNIEFLNWNAKHPNATPEMLATAPPAKVTVPVFAEKDYKVSKHKKIGFIQLSFRIVDVETGENIQVKTLERKVEVEDTGSAGLKEAGVEYDPVEIPTDTELLQQMTDEVVAELGREALHPLQNYEKTYFQQGETLLRRRDYLLAAERYVDALFDEKVKQVQASPLTQQSRDRLDEIFRDYRVTGLGG